MAKITDIILDGAVWISRAIILGGIIYSVWNGYFFFVGFFACLILEALLGKRLPALGLVKRLQSKSDRVKLEIGGWGQGRRRLFSLYSLFMGLGLLALVFYTSSSTKELPVRARSS